MSIETNQVTISVTETGRVAVISTYHGPTNHNGSRITVRRADGGGKRITVSWDYSLDGMKNHAKAITAYLEMMQWEGSWIVGATATGAVATWNGWA